MKYFLPVVILFVTGQVFCQNTAKIDSLKRELKNAKYKASLFNELAGIYINISPEEALGFARKASEEAIKRNDKKELGEALWIIARYYLSTNDYDESNRIADSASRIFHETGNYESEVNCRVMKATTLMLQGNYNAALKEFKWCAQEAKKIGARHIYSSVLVNMGRIYRARGNYDTALSCFENGLSVAKEIKHHFMEGVSYYFIGLIYQDQQKYDLAIENYLIALPMYEDPGFNAQRPYLLLSLGSAYQEIRNYNESLVYYRKALKELKAINDRWGLSELYSNLGSVYFDMNRLDSARTYYERSMELYKEIDDIAGKSNALNSLGEIQIYRENYVLALDYLNKALLLNKKVENTIGRVNILLNLGKCYVAMGSIRKGLDILNRSLDIANSMNFTSEQMALHKEISAAYTKLRSFENALKHYEMYSALNDSIYRRESNSHFMELEQKYQSEKREREIGQLKLDKIEQDITIRKQRSVRNILIVAIVFAIIIGVLLYRSYKTKKKSDSEKEALLKEIHHRVKNNLQIISSLLSIQTENVTDVNVIGAVKESQSRVKAMALIHQLLYQDRDLTRIDFSNYLPQLVHAVLSIFKKENKQIRTTVEAQNIAFDTDTAIPLGLIITELVSNACKYAFYGKQNGEILVNIRSVGENKYQLSVADNGQDLPHDIDFNKLDSMGLRLVRILTSQLEGVFSYRYNKGSIFTVEFTDSL